MKMKTTLFLLLFWLSNNAFADAISLETFQQWVKSIRHTDLIQINGSFEPVYVKEGDEHPIDYRFISAKPEQTSVPRLIYMDEPIQKLIWGDLTYELRDIYKRWGFPQDTMPWSWDNITLYQLKVGEHSYTCLESNFSGLGLSGSMQFHKAVLVLEAGQALEKLYFSGRYAGCYMVGDYTGDGRLGYVQIKHFAEDEIDHAEVRVLKCRPEQIKAVKAFILRDNLPAQPLPLDQFGELPK